MSYTRPDQKGESKAAKLIPENQQSIEAFLIQHAGGNDLATAMNATVNATASVSKDHTDKKIIYLTDIKTRSARSIPDTSSTLPTEFEIFIYDYFVEQLVRGNLPLQAAAERYGLDVMATFSDAFIAEVGSLNEGYQDALSSQTSPGGRQDADDILLSQDSIDMLTSHSCLASLWELMLSYYQQVFVVSWPNLSESPELRLSPILTATYLSSDTSDLIGHKTFNFDQDILDAYLKSGMQWWRGERPAKGVDLTEVNRKCRWCDFRDECEWLQEHDLANLRRVREKWRARDPVSVV